MPVRPHPEPQKFGNRARHEPLAARLVDGSAARLDHDHLEPAKPRADRRRKPDWATAHHGHIAVEFARRR
ncbi:hypothetical protein GCM10011399_34970 [Subtercola lobariae]|uniref:Uncharacterized protein n=1 Tax=Subtercola lobariae TaxID=1588641 RepID=A0A917BG09_9MICO|nr:hypothetical protein GCM10011399_34970 [Subtercola lobariae]